MKKASIVRTAAWLGSVLLVSCAAPVETGSDRLLELPYRDWLLDKRVGLVTNQTGINRKLVPTWQILDNHADIELVALFAPEHGFSGSVQAGLEIKPEGRVHSLYGQYQAPTPEMLAQVDVLLYDIQDVGSRFYTYISTLLGALESAARENIPLIVLDRPNPLTGQVMEGPVLEPALRSFVGAHPLPIRYGMTPGELARLFNHEANIRADLKVVPLKNWKRSLWFDETELPWVFPSPNMPTLATATVYPGFCLLEGTNLSEGRGTTRPFELIGAPWLDSSRLVERLNRLGLPGVRFRVQAFKPTFSKFAGQLCQGLQVHVTDRQRFRPVAAAVHLLAQVHELHPLELVFNRGFDRLGGSVLLRQALEADRPAAEILKAWQPELESFRKRQAPFLLYP